MITLEISSTDIKLMETEGKRVIRWASRSLEPGLFEDEVVSDPQALGAAVNQLMASSGIKGKNVTASVVGLYSLSRIVMVLNPPTGPITRRTVLEAAREVMPLSEDELYLSWQTVATVENGQQVLVVGVPRDVIDSQVQALRMRGVNPRILDLKTMALMRAVNREQALILNIEPTSFDTVMVVDGVAEVMHTSAWQPGDLSVSGRAEHLAVALDLTVGFYNSHHPGLPLDPTTPLFVTGSVSGDLALVEELQARVAYPFEPLAPPLEYPEHLPVSQYAVNIGLALKGTASSESLEQGAYSLPDINLLPQAYQPWKPSARQMYAFLAIVAAIALLFPFYQVTSGTMDKTANLEVKLTAVNSLLTLRQEELRKREPLQKAVNEYDSIVDMGGGFIEDLEVIRSQAERLGIEIKSIKHTGNGITVSCQADSYITFRNYVAALEESGRFLTPVTPPEGYPYIKGGTIKLKPQSGE